MLLAEDFSHFHYKKWLFYFMHIDFVALVIVTASFILQCPATYRRGEAVVSQFITQVSAH